MQSSRPYRTMDEAHVAYASLLRDAERRGDLMGVMAEMGRRDLWFLMTRILKRHDMLNSRVINPQWLFDRVWEVQLDPDGVLDLWAREHYKSTIITYALTIQDILNNPEITVGIFSVQRELAQDFLKQIKQEFENNTLLKDLYPDVLYADPEKESPCWGVDKGIRVRRNNNSREETVEAWGLLNGMPTGKHFKLLLYDDVVTERSVTNPDQLAKTYDKLRLSFPLGSHGGKKRFIGTRYHFNDAWGQLLKDRTARVRMHPATDNGMPEGEPVFISREALTEKRREMGPYIFACQMLQDPVADAAQGFREAWLRYWDPKGREDWQGMNRYLLIDPAGEKKTSNDYTVMLVIGLAEDGNYYLIDGVRDRLNLTERAEWVFRLHRAYKPVAVGYEKYGMQADIEHIEYEMRIRNYRFDIQQVGGSLPKNDRIRKLVPIFEQHRFFLPGRLTFKDHEGAYRELVQEFVQEEFLAFPVGAHDDMLDCMARITDPVLGAEFPEANPDAIAGKPGEWGVQVGQMEYDMYA